MTTLVRWSGREFGNGLVHNERIEIVARCVGKVEFQGLIERDVSETVSEIGSLSCGGCEWKELGKQAEMAVCVDCLEW